MERSEKGEVGRECTDWIATRCIALEVLKIRSLAACELSP